MDDADQLRQRASRLFALALKARESGLAHADELEQLANETMEQAEQLEGRGISPDKE